MKTLDEFDGSRAWELQSRGTRDTSQGETSITLYLREIGPVKLLTPQEEIELAARIKKEDREAREQMIKANLRLVVKIARDYEGLGVALLDLVSEGNIGLLKAVDRFDPSKGGKFSSYAVWWIKQAVARAFNQSKTIRLPTHIVDELAKLGRASLRLQEELGREPTDEELAAEMGTTSSRVTQMRIAALRPASLDAPLDGEVSRSYSEAVADEKAETPYEQLEDKAFRALLQEVLETLDRQEQTILRSRFGLDGDSPKTLEETGVELGFSGERVRQIQKVALEKLRRRIKSAENGAQGGSRASLQVRTLQSTAKPSS